MAVKNDLTKLVNDKGYTVTEFLVEAGICMSTFQKNSKSGTKKFAFLVKQVNKLENKNEQT